MVHLQNQLVVHASDAKLNTSSHLLCSCFPSESTPKICANFIKGTRWLLRVPITVFQSFAFHLRGFSLEAGEKESRPLHWSLKLSWILYNISSLTAIVVTVLFWVILYPDYKRECCDPSWNFTSSLLEITFSNILACFIRKWYVYDGVCFSYLLIVD